jgi:hypothetical protein
MHFEAKEQKMELKLKMSINELKSLACWNMVLCKPQVEPGYEITLIRRI